MNTLLCRYSNWSSCRYRASRLCTHPAATRCGFMLESLFSQGFVLLRSFVFSFWVLVFFTALVYMHTKRRVGLSLCFPLPGKSIARRK